MFKVTCGAQSSKCHRWIIFRILSSLGGWVRLPLKACTFSENTEVTSQWWISDSGLESQVEDRFHCEKCRASPAVTPYLWHIHTTQGRSDKHGQVWLWQDSLAQFGRRVVILSFLQIVKCITVRLRNISADFYHKSTHQNTEQPPKAFRISLRKLITELSPRGTKTQQWPQHECSSAKSLRCERDRKLSRVSLSVCLGEWGELINHLSSWSRKMLPDSHQTLTMTNQSRRAATDSNPSISTRAVQ